MIRLYTPGNRLFLTAVAVVVAVQAVFGDSERDPDALKELAEKVTANEHLYKTLDLRGSVKYEYLGSPDRSDYKTDLVLGFEKQIHSVVQNHYGYYSSDCSKRLYGSSLQNHDISSYDGINTFFVSQDRGSRGMANIHDGKSGNLNTIRPHMLVLATVGGLGVDLSAFLQQKSFANFQKIQTAIDGEELIDGLSCIRVRVGLFHDRQKAETGVRWLWLCPKRNYLPVKLVGFLKGDSETVPIERAIVNRFNEAEPGVWVPMQMSFEIMDEQSLRQGKEQLSNRHVWTIDAVDLHSNHPKEFFSNIAIPSGATVQRLRDGKVYDRYRQP